MSSYGTWHLDQMPDQTGKRALVTGVTSGIGEVTALELARRGAEVILGARSAAKLDATEIRIRAQVPEAKLRRLIIDVSEMQSVRQAAEEAAEHGALDILINNAGVMFTPNSRTKDGFELQLATNHFGPFLLTGLLLPRLVESGAGRVVAVASFGHRGARRAPLDDPRIAGKYNRYSAYFGSKLANLLFTFELDRRLRAKHLPVKALAAHPGYASTNLTVGKGTTDSIMHAATAYLGQPPDMGALPTLMAATADLPGSSYVGPSGPGELRGHPHIVGTSRLARDRTAQRRMWEISEQATGIRYP